jgi:UDP-N-acetyl-D-galactosamine dehydrogenase
MNEMSLICNKIEISTNDVIEAAASKWNFMPFTPGLVGGHCIGVDPYYLASLAEKIGHHPQVILAGRRTNDGMVRHIADATLRLMVEKGGVVRDMRVGVFGVTFKENVPDIRNSKSLELVNALRAYGIAPIVHDPHCSSADAEAFGVELCTYEEMSDLDVVVLATAHAEYNDDPRFLTKLRHGGILIDVKGAFRNSGQAKALNYWSL